MSHAPSSPGFEIVDNLPVTQVTVPDLKYPVDSLEPFIDTTTLRIQHDTILKSYADGLNNELKELAKIDPELASMPPERVIREVSRIAEKNPQLAEMIRQHGGGYLNHITFFDNMLPVHAGGGDPLRGLDIVAAITYTFGGIERFRLGFAQEAVTKFGSGWLWLVLNAQKKLEIRSTSNEQSPVEEEGITPILALDLWEHAYYIKHQADRVAYINHFMSVIDWATMNARFTSRK
eukprot:TRINITY_DN13836_c0_g1_i1.p1 TRINITY_DN13836_c0_g1~~TRINITY_DN13836_c0_g1_i1.p1  ORF type:complete len:234 (+),score=28.24 TRINITY_DN13836_c0_g1_i1:255-956(+)